jgi:hypothetical protein
MTQGEPIQWFVCYFDTNGEQSTSWWTRQDAIDAARFLHTHQLDATLRRVKSSDGKVTISAKEILGSG